MAYRLSTHAEQEMRRRQVPHWAVDAVLNGPQQIVPERGGRAAYQSQLDLGGGRVLLVRAIVDDRVEPSVVVTVYRTSKIAKYWRTT